MIDKQQFETIFRRHYDRMYRLARHLLGDDSESRDVVSDVFARLLDGKVDLKSETLQGYLLQCVRNSCLNLLTHRQTVRQHQQAIIVEMNARESTNDESERLSALRFFISSQLPPLTQEILRLRYQEGLKYREIAEVLQVSEVTVHNHLSQSLKQLKKASKSLNYGIE